MYLKRIELAGFKSFASRTKIEFEPGMTAIVGPNGSGKSNITEAIRWVMGEQSAKNLRGDKMNDIIFAGTSKRSPLNIAEVTLVIDNSDGFLPVQYNEVSITRSLNRAGDSDFMINQQPCRLRDIINLFTDSGLGKHSFAMISQGRVAEIFENKPEDRRYLFEEAAGVLKYKQRKTQAERKLTETEENLDRIDDILYELEQQLNPLEKQAKIAKQYKLWQQRYIQLDQSLAVEAIQQWQAQKKASQLKMKRLLRQKEELKQKQIECHDVISQLQEAIQSYEQIQDKKHVEQIKLVEQLEKIESSRQILVERTNFNAQTEETIVQQKNQVQLEQRNLIRHQEEIAKQYQQCVNQERTLKKEKKSLELEYRQWLQSNQMSLKGLQTQYFDLMQRQSDVRNKLQTLDNEHERKKMAQERDQKRFEEYQTQISVLQKRIASHQLVIHDLSAESNQLSDEINEQQTIFEELCQRQKEKVERYRTAQRIYEQAQAKLEGLQHVQSQRTGLVNSVKFVLDQSIDGVIGVVAEQIKVPPKLAEAIEGALGANVQNIIVEDESVAKEAIHQLRKSGVGKATFLPLNVMKGRYIPSDILDKCLGTIGFIGVAANLVQHDGRIHEVIQSLLGQYLVIETLDQAIHLADQIRHRYPIVTLKGDIIRQGGAMTGGKQSKNGLLTQHKQLDQLKIDMKSMEDKMDREQQAIQRMEEKKVSIQELISQKMALKTINKQKVQQLNQEIDDDSKQVRQLEQEESLIEINSLGVDEQYSFEKQQSEEQLLQLGSEIAAKKREIDLCEQQSEERSNYKNELSEQKNTIELQLGLVAKEKQYLSENKKRVEKQLSEKQQRLNQINQQLEHLKTMGSGQNAQELEQQLIQTKKQLNALEQLMERQKSDNQQRQHSLQEYQTEWSQLGDRLQEVALEYQKQELRLEGNHSKINDGLQYIQHHYHETYESLLKHVHPVEEKAVEQRQHLKKKMDQLGNINMQAIEQYDEVYERYSFIQQQHDDLLLAKHQLKETMAEMDQQVKEKFLVTFKAVSDAFSELFPQIFGGGMAQLKLTQPDALLETGIEIEAQPPGKKLQTLTLLSGGEQALTAITLLFAILKVKPTPFCVLDEVEAALDNANITRLGRYLKLFDQQTQFIMITHRKGIMEAADTLYGVTMTEPGVSDVLSIRLEDVS